MAIKYPPADVCISKQFRGDPKGSRFISAGPPGKKKKHLPPTVRHCACVKKYSLDIEI